MPQFSRITIIEAIDSLKSLNHAELSRFLLKFGLEEVAPQDFGSKTSRLNALIKYLIDNPGKQGPSGVNLTFEIIEDALGIMSSTTYARPIEERLPKLVNSLKRDGYIIKLPRYVEHV